MLDESIKTLKLIFALGGIHCRKSLKNYGIIYNEKNSIFNGDDYISICIDNPLEEEFYDNNIDLDSSFFRYVKTKIAIEFKASIEENCKFR